jgi:hypothetical protein
MYFVALSVAFEELPAWRRSYPRESTPSPSSQKKEEQAFNLRGCLKNTRLGESVEHDANSCNVDYGLRRLHHVLTVFVESGNCGQASEAALHDPGQAHDLESTLSSLDDLQFPTSGLSRGKHYHCR